MCMRESFCLFAVIVVAGCQSVQAQADADRVRLVVRAEQTQKLAPALAAAKQVGGTLIGVTKAGQAVVEMTAASAAAAMEQVARFSGILEQDDVVPEDIESTDQFIVMYQPGQALEKASLGTAGLELVSENEEGSFVVVRSGDGLSAATIAALENDPRVAYVEPDYLVRVIPPAEDVEEEEADPEADSGIAPTRSSNDPKYGSLWGMTNIHAPRAWNTVTGSPIVVAVIDTGVDYNHPDLKGNMWRNRGEVKDGKDNDGNGFPDDIHGYDFVNNDGDPMDDHSHGTHCAGTVGAVGNNGIGVVGVNWRVKIMALKFLSASGGGNTSNAIKCVQYARKNGARVMSNSWGGGGHSKALSDEISRAEKAGILFVAAAGNGYGRDNDASPHYPSSYPQANVIAVASITKTNKLSTHSNLGKKSVDLAAPGSSVYSTLPSNKYGSKSGTSMATPHVSGAAALIWGHVQHGRSSWRSVKSMLLNNARRISALSGKCVTGGTLDIGFLETATKTWRTIEAYNDFNRKTLTGKPQTLTSVTFTLPTTMFVHITAQTTARQVKPSGSVTVTTGLTTSSSASTIYTRSLRRAQFGKAGAVQPMTTSFGRRMGPGRYTVRWNVWPRGAQLVTDSGTLMIEAFGSKGGGILEIGADDLDTMELLDDGTIQRHEVKTTTVAVE